MRNRFSSVARPRWGAALAAAALLLGVLAVGCTQEDPAAGEASVTARAPGSSDQGGSTTPVQMAPVELPDLVEQVMNSVVLIEGNTRSGNVSGAGVVIDTDGHILTNYHVIEGQASLKVTLADGSASLATVVGVDPGNDLALILADGFTPEDLRPATFGNSDDVRVGETVFAIGNPFTQTFSVSSGIISATGRSSETFGGRRIQGVLQTDAALNPGNSGGPLFNLDGEVIGINTSIENPYSRSFAGLGFAVPSNTAERYLAQMMAGETVVHPQLGISPVRLDEVESAAYGVDIHRGLYVGQVTPGGAAERAGLQAGDVILELNGRQTHTFEELAQAIDASEIGQEVTIVYWRGGQEATVTATLQPWDASN